MASPTLNAPIRIWFPVSATVSETVYSYGRGLFHRRDSGPLLALRVPYFFREPLPANSIRKRYITRVRQSRP